MAREGRWLVEEETDDEPKPAGAPLPSPAVTAEGDSSAEDAPQGIEDGSVGLAYLVRMGKKLSLVFNGVTRPSKELLEALAILERAGQTNAAPDTTRLILDSSADGRPLPPNRTSVPPDTPVRDRPKEITGTNTLRLHGIQYDEEEVVRLMTECFGSAFVRPHCHGGGQKTSDSMLDRTNGDGQWSSHGLRLLQWQEQRTAQQARCWHHA